MMRRGIFGSFLVCMLALSMLVTACGGSASKPADQTKAPAAQDKGAAPAPAPAQPVNVTVAYPAAPMPPYIPSLLVGETSKGHIVAEPKFLSAPNLAVQGLLKNEVQIAMVPMVNAVQAILEGADLTIVGGQFQNEWQLVAPAGIADVNALNGKRIAIHSESSATNTVLQWTLKKSNLKDVKVVVIPGTAARAQALTAGQIDASPIGLGDLVTLDKQQPGKFHVVQNYAKLIPEIVGNVLVVRKDYLAKNGQAVQDYLQALLETHRHIAQDPAWAAANAPSVFKNLDPELFKAIVNAYATSGVWDLNGGLTPELTKSMLSLMRDNKEIKIEGDIDVNKFVDMKPLEAVLAKIGKK